MRAGSPLAAGELATVMFDTGTDAWTLGFDAAGASLSTRRVRRADAVLFAPLDVMAGIVEGTASGVDAWLSGELTMRGNIALALKLQGTIHPDGPARIPRARTVPAHAIDTFYLEAGNGPAWSFGT